MRFSDKEATAIWFCCFFLFGLLVFCTEGVYSSQDVAIYLATTSSEKNEKNQTVGKREPWFFSLRGDSKMEDFSIAFNDFSTTIIPQNGTHHFWHTTVSRWSNNIHFDQRESQPFPGNFPQNDPLKCRS
jgi:hypothetical protein